MDKNLIKEIRRFFRNSYKKILIMGLILGVLYTAVSFLTAYLNQRQASEMQVENVVEEDEELAKPGAFRFYVENKQGEMYSNITIFEEYFLLEQNIRRAEIATDVNISDLLEQQEISDFEKTISNRGVLGVGRNPSSGIYTFKSNLGDEEANLKAAEFYYKYLLSGDIPVLEDKSLYIVEEPYLIELTEEEVTEMLPPQPLNTASRIIKRIGSNLLIGTIAGLMAALFFYLFKSIISNKITYSFSYNWGVNDHHYILDKGKDDLEEAMSLVAYPAQSRKIILSDISNLAASLAHRVEQVTVTENIYNIEPSQRIDEVIFVLKSHETSKVWYYNQRAFVDPYQIKVKVIQVNN